MYRGFIIILKPCRTSAKSSIKLCKETDYFWKQLFVMETMKTRRLAAQHICCCN